MLGYPGMTPTDAAIVERVLGGDREAFRLLVDRHYDRCLRVATHLLGDVAEAEDAVQEAMLRAFRYLGSYQEREKFGAWLARIVVNQCRTLQARRRGRRDIPGLGEAQLDVPDERELPGDERATMRAELERALAQLSPDQREAVVLRFADDLTFDEMATVTGVGVSALKMRVQRACARLRALLTENSCV
jgi:RNA polymerase sigma-70 factor (ECF subfamily)